MVLFAILQFLLIGVAFLGGFLYYQIRYDDPQVENAQFPVLAEAFTLLEKNAYFELPATKTLEYGMIQGMIKSYDEPFTVFVEPPQHELQTQKLQGKYGGVGIRLERDAENNVYLYPLPKSPALAVGLKDGDRLLKIGDIEISPKTTDDEIQAAIRGPVGQKVSITIGRGPNFAPLVFTVNRDEVSLPSITYNLVPDQPLVGIVHIHVIANTTSDEVKNAISSLQKLGAQSFIMDVRNNGGGLVEAGVDTARLFLKSGVVIDEQYRGKPVKTYKVDRAGPFSELPIVVLVNKGTASAAEIFAGSLQGQKRAPIVGTNTYGKDTIQLVFNLSDGSSIHVTAAHWWIPGLESKITGQGLQPDIVVDENAGDNLLIQAAVDEILRKPGD